MYGFPIDSARYEVVSRDLFRLLGEVATERRLQNEKWGEQNHPNAPEDLSCLGFEPPHEARLETAEAAEQGFLTWAHIAVEKLAEAIDAPNDDKCRHELIQLAAVAIAWIECIDRRPPPSPPKAAGA